MFTGPTSTRFPLVQACVLAILCGPVDAQEPPGDEQRVTITGSNVSRIDLETPSPVQVLTADDLKRSGFTTLSQVLANLTANGQGTLSQSFAAAGAAGSSGIALRGLTVGSTLVLIDGHRMAPYPLGDDAQRSFVDISNLPFDVVDRVEVLKDGASAVYGSDAIAGVVNVILKRSFPGKAITADAGTSYKGDGSAYHLAGIWGFGDLERDGQTFYVAGELRTQEPIRLADRGGLYTQTDFTSTGGYDLTRGVPNVLNGNLPESATGYITDASGNIVAFMPGCDRPQLSAKQCTFPNTWSLIQPPTRNDDLVGRYARKLGADFELALQGSYFESRSRLVRRPATTFSGGFQGVTSGPGIVPQILPALPATSISSGNPSFPAGAGTSTGLLHDTFLDVGPNVTDTDARSTRFVVDLTGKLASWNLSASAGLTQVRLRLTGRGNVEAGNLQAALDSPTNPYLVGGQNSAEVIDFIAPTLRATDVSRLGFVQLLGRRDVWQLAGGPLSIALGSDYFHRTQHAQAPEQVADGLVSSFSNTYAVGAQSVGSVYTELVAPFSRRFEAEAAVRYDHYNLSGGRTSPKIGAKFSPMRELAFRGTFGRGFRAPGPAENGAAGTTFVTGTSSDPVLCHDTSNPGAVGNFPSQCAVRVATVQGANPGLKPETSKSATLGMLVEPSQAFNAAIDVYWIELEHQIISGSDTTPVRGSNLTPLPQVQPDGTIALVTPPVAPIAFYSVGYVNATRTTTSGVDLDVQWKHRLAGGVDYKTDFMLTYMNRYDLAINGATYRLAGTHGPLGVSGDTGNPRTRIQWSHTVSQGAWSVTGTFNHVGSFDLTDPSSGVTDCATGLTVGAGASAYASQLGSGIVPEGVKCRVRAFTTLDLWGSYAWSRQLSLHASIQNLFNAGAPQDWATYGGSGAPYNPAFHLQGDIGRSFSLGARFEF